MTEQTRTRRAGGSRRGLGGRLRWLRALLAVTMGSVVLSGCDFDVYKLPLPGGVSVGDDPMTVTAMFRDVLDLVPKSTVKVNDVNVGQVTDVRLDGYTAKVTMSLRKDVDLPDNTFAEIRQTSLLGEKFVSLAPPESDESSNPLADGDVIDLDRTGRNPEIEEVLGALSLLLNGGGIGQLQTINRELNAALGGREDAARSVLTQIDTFTANLDAGKGDILAALESLNRLSLEANRQLPTIDAALAELPSALTAIDAQRSDLVRTLQALDQLSDVGVRVISQSKASTIASLRQLQPVLTQLADSGSAFVDAFNVFYAYPFVDEAVGRDPQVARNLHMGDYTNLDVKLDVNLNDILPTALPTNLPNDVVDALQKCLATGPDPTSEACRSIVGSAVLRDYCNKPANRGSVLCTLPGTPGGGGGGGGGLPSGVPTALPSTITSMIPTQMPSLPLTGLIPRAGTAWSAPTADGTGGPTVAQLTEIYDADLVALMVPALMSSGRASQ